MSDQTTWLFINSFAPWLAALGTVASVIVSLYLALRASRSDIRVFICIIQLFDSDPKEKLLQISAVNHSRKAVVKTIMWRSLGCFGRRKQDWIVQPLDPRSTKLPCDLGFGEEANCRRSEQVGIGKSEVSRETIEAGTRVLQDVAERDFSKVDVLIIYLDGIQFGNHHVLAAVGVDADGKKYVLGVHSGASENATVTTALLKDLVARGIRPDRRRLFVVDGAKALRSAIAQVFGAGNEVQRCRNHKLRNVVGHLPNAQHDQARATLRAAWKLEAKEGMRKLDQYASWLQRDWPDAAASVREGLDEIFTVNRLGLPAALRTCLTTTNIIDSTHSGIRQRTRRVTNWKNGEMALRWSAVAFVETEKNYRRITGYEHLWMLKAHLDRDDDNVAEMQKVG